MEEKEKFHITITNNETGEVLVDENTGGILGVIDLPDTTRSVIYTACNSVSMAAVLCAAKDRIEEVKNDHPSVARLVNAYERAHKPKRESIFSRIKNKIFNKKKGEADEQ